MHLVSGKGGTLRISGGFVPPLTFKVDSVDSVLGSSYLQSGPSATVVTKTCMKITLIYQKSDSRNRKDSYEYMIGYRDTKFEWKNKRFVHF